MPNPNWCPFIVKKHKDFIQIYEPVFCENFYVVIMPTAVKFKEFANKHLGLNLDLDDTDSGAFVPITDKKANATVGLIWSKDKKETLNHELLHATTWALGNRGIKLSDDSDEIFCYYQGFLLKCITEK